MGGHSVALPLPAAHPGGFQPGGSSVEIDMFRPLLCSLSPALSGGSFVLGQTPTVIDGTFDPGSGADDDVFALALQPDGRILIGGAFTTVNGENRTYLARLLTHGLPDPDFIPPPINNELRAVIVQPDDRILIAGDFSYWNEIRRPMRVWLFGEPLFFSPAELRGGTFQIEVSHIGPRVPVILLASTNLVQWEPVQTNSSPQSPVHFLDANTARIPRRFFRAMQADH
jgi:hypothetical protein